MSKKSEIYGSQECISFQLLLWKVHILAFMGLLLLLDTVAFGQSHVWKFSRIVCRISMCPIQSCWFLYLTQFFIEVIHYLCRLDHSIYLCKCFELFAVIMKLWLAAGITICRQVKKDKVGTTVQKLTTLFLSQCKSLQTFSCHCPKVEKPFLSEDRAQTWLTK